MFSRAAVRFSTHHRATPAHFLSEVVATLGLILVIFALARSRTVPERPGGHRRLHRCGLLLHQLDQLRQPGHHRGPDVLQHLRRHRPLLGTAASSLAQVVGGVLAVLAISCSTRTSPRPRPPTSSSPIGIGRPGRRRSSDVTDKPVVVFLCVHNAGRSLAARVLLDHYAKGRIRVESAGSEPGDRLNPSVVAVLQSGASTPPGSSRSPSPTRRPGWPMSS